jgi:predicted RNase H-like nuclease (RuvC/YqgF family)
MSIENKIGILEDHKYDLEDQQGECQGKIESFEKLGLNTQKLEVQFTYLCKAIESTEDEINDLENKLEGIG